MSVFINPLKRHHEHFSSPLHDRTHVVASHCSTFSTAATQIAANQNHKRAKAAEVAHTVATPISVQDDHVYFDRDSVSPVASSSCSIAVSLDLGKFAKLFCASLLIIFTS